MKRVRKKNKIFVKIVFSLTSIGWGTQYYGGPTSTVLMEVTVPVWPQDKCVRSFTQRITDTTMCAGAYEGGRDACQVRPIVHLPRTRSRIFNKVCRSPMVKIYRYFRMYRKRTLKDKQSRVHITEPSSLSFSGRLGRTVAASAR